MNKQYKTKDIYMAAILLALGAKLEKTDRTDPRHQEFEFSTPETGIKETDDKQVKVQSGLDFECIETAYANADLMVNAVAFKEAIQRMKSLIHSS